VLPQIGFACQRDKAAQRDRSDRHGRSAGDGFLLLGAAYAAQQQYDQASAAFDRAAAIRPNLNASMLAAGESLMALRQFPQAIQMYRRALKARESPETWYQLARAYFLREVSSGQREKDWAPFKEAMKKARDGSTAAWPSGWRLAILEAQLRWRPAKALRIFLNAPNGPTAS